MAVPSDRCGYSEQDKLPEYLALALGLSWGFFGGTAQASGS
jgi:hypothetical protein